MSKGQTENYRLTLRFNPNDEVQMSAYEALQDKGRRKSAFIAEAIAYYIKNNGLDSDLTSINEDAIRKIVLKIMKEAGFTPLVTVPENQVVEVETETNITNVEEVIEKTTNEENEKPTIENIISEAVDSGDIDDLIDGLDIFSS